MSGDLFSDLARWWREGWQAGANAPAVGPSVGRGLFSNWFLTERQREIDNLEALHARVLAQHEASPLGEDDAVFVLVREIVSAIFEKTEASYQRALLDACYDPIFDLIDDELIWFPRYGVGDIGRLDMAVRAKLRAYLLQKDRLYAAYEARMTRVKGALVDLVTDVFDAMAAGDDLAADFEPDALTLNMTLGGVIEDAGDLLDGVLQTFCHDQSAFYQDDLFDAVRTQLMRNLCVASNINPDGPPSDRPFVMPRDGKAASVGELTETYLQYTPLQQFFDASIPIVVPESVRSEHALIVGGSGHGKTQLLQHLIHHDLVDESERPPGVIVIDSQGDLIHTLARLDRFNPDVEGSLADRLVIIDPSDVEFPVALNLFAFDQARLKTYSRADRQRVLGSVIDLYEYFFSALLGAELTQKQGVVFRYLARLMLEIPDATVQTLRALMEDGKPFKPFMEKLDGSARQFFKTEFFSPSFSATKKQILRRLWGVLANEIFERMFSHPANKLDLFDAMNDGKIVLINTAKDMLKREGCSIFGRFFIAKIAQAALERATIDEANRRPVHVYIDEAHDYFDETMEQLFSQARKYKVGLHIAAQNLDQMPAKLKSTVLSSTAMKFAGGVSAKDARALAPDMYTEADFIQATRKRRGRSEFATFVKNRTPSAISIHVELGRINGLDALDETQFATLIDQNRTRYCVPLEEVGAIIATSFGKADETDAPPPKTDRPEAPPSTADAHASPAAASEPEPPDKAHGRTPGKPVTQPQPDPTEPELQAVADPYVAGVGSREHRNLQNVIRKLAQERNFKATVEKPVLDGAGSIDVALEHADLTIAVEVSISTYASHERGNVEKGLRAGFDEVFLVVAEHKKREQFRKTLLTGISAEARKRIFILAPSEVARALDQRAANLAGTENTVRGWRVKTTYSTVSPEDAKLKREAIAKILTGSGRPGPKKPDPT